MCVCFSGFLYCLSVRCCFGGPEKGGGERQRACRARSHRVQGGRQAGDGHARSLDRQAAALATVASATERAEADAGTAAAAREDAAAAQLDIIKAQAALELAQSHAREAATSAGAHLAAARRDLVGERAARAALVTTADAATTEVQGACACVASLEAILAEKTALLANISVAAGVSTRAVAPVANPSPPSKPPRRGPVYVTYGGKAGGGAKVGKRKR